MPGFIRQNITTLIYIIIIIFFCSNITFADTVISDPDYISTGIEYRGITDLRLGETFEKDKLSFGGMVEIRNESRFNQEILPNHNWRGFAFVYVEQPISMQQDLFNVTCGFEHESAHPTMGLNDGNDKAYDKIYDSTYRNINLNSFLSRFSCSVTSGYILTFSGDLQLYFKSRNTPELPINDLTWSEGISGGIELQYPLNTEISCFISSFDRYIFQSRKKISGSIYYNTVNGVESIHEKYPIINNVNTVTFKTGFILNNLIPEKKVSIYCGILYGNIFGFVDSRENRILYSFGVELFH